MGWQLSFSQRFELAQLRELTASNAHRVMKQAWDQLELDSSLCGAHKVNSKPIVDRNGAWMQSAKLPHLARGGENISLDIPFYRIPLSQVPRQKTLCSTRTLLAGALVDRALSMGHPWDGCMNQELRQSLSEFTVISMIVQH